MFKAIVTGAVISKGFENNPAIRLSENKDVARFRIGIGVYDKNAENNKRWINLGVKAFGGVCERIQKMQLKEGSYVNLIARYDEETWTDKTTNEQKSAPVLIVDEIEYCFSEKSKNSASNDNANPAPAAQPNNASGSPSEMPNNFTGFESFGGDNPFFKAE